MNNDKQKLWTSRGNDFRSSGLTCRAWCDEHQISSSTMGYWVRKLDRNENESSDPELVFAKLPSEQELTSKANTSDQAPIRIFISDHVHVEIMPSCPPVLLQSLIGALKEHA